MQLIGYLTERWHYHHFLLLYSALPRETILDKGNHLQIYVQRGMQTWDALDLVQPHRYRRQNVVSKFPLWNAVHVAVVLMMNQCLCLVAALFVVHESAHKLDMLATILAIRFLLIGNVPVRFVSKSIDLDRRTYQSLDVAEKGRSVGWAQANAQIARPGKMLLLLPLQVVESPQSSDVVFHRIARDQYPKWDNHLGDNKPKYKLVLVFLRPCRSYGSIGTHRTSRPMSPYDANDSLSRHIPETCRSGEEV